MSTSDKTGARGGSLFTQPVTQIVIMLAVITLFCFGAWAIHGEVKDVFLANPFLNGVIALVFAIGVLSCVWQVIQLVVSISWVEDFAAERADFDMASAPRLLAALAGLLRTRGAQAQISNSSARSILESVATRIDEARDITRYLTNLLIFLGLLGTFYGLATTVPGVVETIRALAPKDGETAVQVFQKLMSGLEMQLGGMGTAFSSSLLGLAGSLVVGLLELFVGHGQNRFYRELEEWLSSITRIGFSSAEGAGEGEGGGMEALAGVLDQIVTRFETLEARASEDRIAITAGLESLAEGFRRLAERDETPQLAGALGQIAKGHDILARGQDRIAVAQDRIADGQDRLLAVVEHESTLGSDAEARMRLRSIDVQLLRILEEMSAGRQESVADLRADLGALTAAIRQLSRMGGR